MFLLTLALLKFTGSTESSSLISISFMPLWLLPDWLMNLSYFYLRLAARFSESGEAITYNILWFIGVLIESWFAPFLNMSFKFFAISSLTMLDKLLSYLSIYLSIDLNLYLIFLLSCFVSNLIMSPFLKL